VKLATDIGGTFTDLVYVTRDGRVGFAKAPSTPPDFSRGVVDVIDKAEVDSRAVEGFVHGSTVVINALTERKGARTGLVTTRGFRDVLGIGRANRPDMYNLRFRKQRPFVPREWCYEVTERMDFRGQVVVPLAEDEVRAVAAAIAREGLESVAVCFLHSYANPEHERRCAQLLRELLPGVTVSASHEITMEWREYERTSTVVLNAYVKPLVGRYLERLEEELGRRGITSNLQVMKSNGGTAPFSVARQQPIHLVESGPVAGVIGAQAVAELVGIDRIISLDIGGTTAKTSLVEAGQVRITTEYRIERDPWRPGYPIKVPVVDIVEIGAGGGSIAWVDEAGAVRVGPESAGSMPGPACYGRGGTRPTVTDANLLTGRLNPRYFLAGDLPLYPEKAEQAIAPLARRFGLSVDETALGILRVANASMVNAIKLVSVRRGYDPREFTLVAFGGGGPLHAAALARELHIRRVLIPPAPGTFSALGMLATQPIQDFIRTFLLRSADENMDRVRVLFRELEEQALAFMEAAGFELARVRLHRSVDMRYHGQEHTVRVPVGELVRQEMEARFHQLHEQAYTFRLDSPVELVNFHVSAVYHAGPVDLRALAPAFAGDGRPKEERRVLFEDAGWVVCPVYERANLLPDRSVEGPAVIEEPMSTTVVYPGQRAQVDRFGNLLLETGV